VLMRLRMVFSRERIVDEIVTFAPAAHLLDAPRTKDKNRLGWLKRHFSVSILRSIT
jgi:hypothetical protein